MKHFKMGELNARYRTHKIDLNFETWSNQQVKKRTLQTASLAQRRKFWKRQTANGKRQSENSSFASAWK